MIHPQAIVHPEARIGAGVSVGPYSVIGPDGEIGADTRIGPPPPIKRPTAPRPRGARAAPPRLEIGDGNVVREFCSLNRGTVDGGGVTRVGRDNFLMAYCHIAHDCQVGSKTVLANGPGTARHVHLGDHAVLGGFTLVHQYCRLGAHCMTAVNTVIFKDVPPFLICSGYSAEPHGINVRGLKRRNFSDDAIESLRRAYKILYRSGHTLDEALKP